MSLQTKNVDGFLFSFVNEQEFDEIYNEVFRVQQYHFSASTQTPFIVDCGANIGITVLYFKKLYPQATILAFEPNPDTFQLLELNIQQNKLSNVQLVNAALSEKEGEIDFYVSLDNESPWKGADTGITSGFLRSEVSRSIKVPSVKLSAYLNREVDFLKMDIEGMEETVLQEIQGKWELIKEARIEFHIARHNTANDLERTLGLLNSKRLHHALERERKILNLQQIRAAIGEIDPYLLMIYAHRSKGGLWWNAWFQPRFIRVQHRLHRLHSSRFKPGFAGTR